jgi:hypothetical protein
MEIPDEAEFKQYLNDMYGDINIVGVSYPAGDVLEELAPTAFAIMYADFCAEIIGGE